MKKKEGEKERSHELEPCLKLKVTLHWLSSLLSSPQSPCREGRIREVNQAWAPTGDLRGGKGVFLQLGPSALLYVCLKSSEWGRRSFFFFLSLCSLLELSDNGSREGRCCQTEDPTHPFCPYQTSLCLSSICYLRLPFCNDALFLLKKDTETEICSVVCVVTVVEDGL